MLGMELLGRRRRPQRRLILVVKEDMKWGVITEEDAKDRAIWKHMTPSDGSSQKFKKYILLCFSNNSKNSA